MTSISQPVINRLENNGKPHDVDSIQRLCDAFGITLSAFFAVEGDALDSLPDDLKAFILDPQNHALIRAIQGMKDKGLSNDMIAAWLGSLSDTITDMRQKIADGQNALLGFAAETKGKYSSEELNDMEAKYQEKLKDQKSMPPWRKKPD